MLQTGNDAGSFPAIESDALGRMMEEVSAFGGGPDGAMTRLALSREDAAARDWLRAWFESEGLRLQVDALGNMFGVLDWAGPGAPTVMTGSHLDSQPNGGRFDGSLGVVAACAAVASLKRKVEAAGSAPKCNFIVANWTNEEGARFQPSVLGSSVYTGALAPDFALDRRDGNGISVREALAEIGCAGAQSPPLPDAYIELHIEGSEHLERAGLRLAAFTRYWGATKYRIAFLGRQAHTGPTPMSERHDAVLAAAYLIAELKAMADKAGLDLHTSVGRMEIKPNSPNVVPAEAVLFAELRSVSPEILNLAEEELNRQIAASATRARVGYEVRSIERRRAGRMDTGLVRLAECTAERMGHRMLHLDTIAGHDAVSMAAVRPSIVLAVPSVGGVIHHPSEFTSPDDCALGAELLAGMLWQFCANGNILASR
ncbi:MAG: Zn-dependent hydrolase [Rhizobiales bacterium]|nr:Zn-dependent hydrolase [Hyphomicrobiales bacterium]